MKQPKIISLFYIRFCFRKAPVLSGLLAGVRLIQALVPTAQMVILAWFLDAVQASFAMHTVTFQTLLSAALLAGLQFGDYLLGAAASFLAMKHRIRAGTAFDFSVISKRSRLEYPLIEDPQVCDLAQRVWENCGDKIHLGFMNLLSVGEYALRILGICVTVLFASIPVGLVSLAMFAVMIPIAIRSGKEDYEAHAKASSELRRAQYFRQILTDQPHAAERKTFDCAEFFSGKWERHFEAGRLLAMKAAKKEFVHLKAGSILIVLSLCAIAALLLIPLDGGAMTTGTYISVVAASANLVQMISWYISFLVEDYTVYKLYLQDYFRLMDLPEEPEEDMGCREPAPTVKKIEFRDVSFRYPGTEKPVLDRLTVTLEAGKTYALVGENGSGKSTLVKLLLGLYPQYEGEILLDGRDIRTLSPQEIRGRFSCAYQDFARYEASLRVNLAPGEESLTQSLECVRLLEKLGLGDCIASLPDGLDTSLGRLEEGGRDLSGGQWQRIAVARALLRHTPVLIMDEPTASLDPGSEKALFRLLLENGDCPIRILITHRLGCVQNVEEILVLSGGKVAEKGSHRELLEKDGIYAEMYRQQRSWYL